MRCRFIKNKTSAYIDGQLGDAERAAYVDHLAGCPSCRAHLTETRAAIDLLRGTSLAGPPSGLLDAVLGAMDRETAPRLTIVPTPQRPRFRRFDGDLVSVLRRFVVDYEFKLVSYGVGVVASCLLMFGTLNALKGIGVVFEPQLSAQTIWISVQESKVMGLTPSDGFATVAYTIPKVEELGGLPQFAATAPPAADEIMVLADVDPYGRASIVEVLSGPTDPLVVERLETALYRPAFKPAKSRSGRAVPSRVILLVQQVEVAG